MIAALLRRQLVRCRAEAVVGEIDLAADEPPGERLVPLVEFLPRLEPVQFFRDARPEFLRLLEGFRVEFLYAAADLMWAFLTNAAEGLNFLPSFCNETMSVCDMMKSPGVTCGG